MNMNEYEHIVVLLTDTHTYCSLELLQNVVQ